MMSDRTTFHSKKATLHQHRQNYRTVCAEAKSWRIRHGENSHQVNICHHNHNASHQIPPHTCIDYPDQPKMFLLPRRESNRARHQNGIRPRLPPVAIKSVCCRGPTQYCSQGVFRPLVGINQLRLYTPDFPIISCKYTGASGKGPK